MIANATRSSNHPDTPALRDSILLCPPPPRLRPEGVRDHVQLALPEDPVPHQGTKGRGGGGSGHLLMKVLVAARDGHDDRGTLGIGEGS